MKIIVGLGNPGEQYAHTPHSIGFEAADALAREIGVSWEFKKAENAFVARGNWKGERVLLVKPQTYMNLSGQAVAPLVKYANATANDLIVIQDDIDLPVGKLRIKKGGSCGGHNGIRNIIERLGSSDFIRVKIGVGKDCANVVGHVLGKFSPLSRKIMEEVLPVCAQAVELMLTSGPDRAMNLFNGWTAPTATQEGQNERS